MTTNYRYYISFLLSVWWILPSHAQSATRFDINVSVGFVSQNIWRGCFEAGGSIQPEAAFSFKNWEASVWGTTGFDGPEKEIDIAVKYNWENFRIAITDYWFGGNMDSYRKNHIPEISLSYSFPRLPLVVGYNAVIGSDDWNFSSYVEISYSRSWEKWYFDFTAGITPWSNTMLDTGSFSVTCLCAGVRKKIGLPDSFSPEASSTLIYNPHRGGIFWVAGINIPF